MSPTGDPDSKHRYAHVLQVIGTWAVEDGSQAASNLTRRQEAPAEVRHDLGHIQTREHNCTGAGDQNGRKFLAFEKNRESTAGKACFSKYVFP
jgi:hypothetical protein